VSPFAAALSRMAAFMWKANGNTATTPINPAAHRMTTCLRKARRPGMRNDPHIGAHPGRTRLAAERPRSAARPASDELWVPGSRVPGRVRCSGWVGRRSPLSHLAAFGIDIDIAGKPRVRAAAQPPEFGIRPGADDPEVLLAVHRDASR